MLLSRHRQYSSWSMACCDSDLRLPRTRIGPSRQKSEALRLHGHGCQFANCEHFTHRPYVTSPPYIWINFRPPFSSSTTRTPGMNVDVSLIASPSFEYVCTQQPTLSICQALLDLITDLSPFTNFVNNCQLSGLPTTTGFPGDFATASAVLTASAITQTPSKCHVPERSQKSRTLGSLPYSDCCNDADF